ncbi:hypothetical protein P8C59_005611 [Phyllachora maydis]|uniref:Uncharacterized protein n=1 Tax=Phyllachora maydis TaxID=1825666 RepID=A0AAD9I4R7_9PEZI|nr:hypothetical protein P8C59_005611 [Phyllachora maydis]
MEAGWLAGARIRGEECERLPSLAGYFCFGALHVKCCQLGTRAQTDYSRVLYRTDIVVVLSPLGSWVVPARGMEEYLSATDSAQD